MNTKTKQLWRMARLPLAVSMTTVLAAPASAFTFQVGEVEGSFDSTLSIGSSWSTASRDKRFIGSANGGTGYTQTGDDGRLNFKKGDNFSKIFKGIHDLELRYKDSGVFMRGKYWYDFKLHDDDLRHPDPSKRRVSNDGRKEGAKTRGIELLDAFVFHNYMIGNQPGTVRLGKQVVSWGESTFIMNSINAINPIDVSAFRRPGAELKEGLIPVNMFYVAQNLTDRLSAEAFYQISWKPTVVDNCGTFFSGADVAANGCNNNYNILAPKHIALLDQFSSSLAPLGVQHSSEGLMVRRGRDNKAKDEGQWGMALRWLGDNTEYGAYFINYHSRNPFLSTQNASSLAGSVGAAGALLNVAGAPTAVLGGAAVAVGNGQYFMDYPEDIRLYGLSFSTTLPTGTAWQGEISYRDNAPVQINTQDLTLNLAANASDMLPGILLGGSSAGYLSQAGVRHKGYNRKEITQIQTTFTHFFEHVLGASRATVVGEIGYVHVGGLESKSKVRYGRDPIFGSPDSFIDPTAKDVYGDDGFVTSNSWGYRLRGQLDYSNAFAGVNLKPNMAFSHDVSGYGPNGLFNEDAKAVSLGLDAEYQNTYTAGISYTNFFDGRYNTMRDRDFLAVTFGMSF